MKRYKLLKDTPTIKAGTIFEEIVNMSDGTRELAVAVPGEDIPQDPQFTIQDIDNFDEWFEEMEEPTDSIYWKPNNGDEYWYIDDCAGEVPESCYITDEKRRKEWHITDAGKLYDYLVEMQKYIKEEKTN